MAPFHTHFRDLAAHETRSVTVRGTPGLPDGEYGFIEFYCDDPGSDCRRVVINVMCSTTGARIWASINYGWESLDFYERWMGDKELARDSQGASLDPFNQQSPYSRTLLETLQSDVPFRYSIRGAAEAALRPVQGKPAKKTLFADSPENKHEAPTIDTGIDSAAITDNRRFTMTCVIPSAAPRCYSTRDSLPVPDSRYPEESGFCARIQPGSNGSIPCGSPRGACSSESRRREDRSRQPWWHTHSSSYRFINLRRIPDVRTSDRYDRRQ